MDSISVFLLVVAGIFFLGTLAEILFRRTGIPDALWLMTVGIFLGPVFHLADLEMVKGVLPYFAAITFIIILFEGGRRLSLVGLKRSVGGATWLAIVTFSSSVVIVASLSWIGVWLNLLDDWSWRRALMLGCILGGSSSVVIIPTMLFMKVSEKLNNLASVESTITDAFCVVGTYLFLDLILQTSDLSFSVHAPILSILQNLGFGIGVGILFGFLWMFVLPSLPLNYDYTITFSALLVLYVFANFIGGSAALAILIASIILGNAALLSRLLKLKINPIISYDANVIHERLTFVVKTFFFVLIGFLLRPPLEPLVFGAFLALGLIYIRQISIRFGFKTSDLSSRELTILKSAAPRGLAAGILATVPYTMRVSGTEHLSTIVFSTIFTSVLFFSVRLSKLKAEPQPSQIPPTA